MTTHKWIDIASHGSGLLRYHEYYRHLVSLLPIEILRDPFDASHGLWLVGEPDTIKDCWEMITTLIDSVEKRSEEPIGMKMKTAKTWHGNKMRGDIKDLMVTVVIDEQLKIAEPRIRELRLISQEKELIRFTYIKETSLLHKLKPFRRAKY